MIVDTHFLKEKSLYRKVALLVTIPCAILPVMMAASLVMNSGYKPVLFKGDFLLALPVYIFYTSGLFLSYKVHHSRIPALIFLVHLVSLIVVNECTFVAVMPYVAIFSLILTSVLNQFYRTGSPACDESCFRQ